MANIKQAMQLRDCRFRYLINYEKNVDEKEKGATQLQHPFHDHYRSDSVWYYR
jgi:hypothetical protein